MAILNITEFTTPAAMALQTADLTDATSQSVNISATSAQSAALDNGCGLVRVESDVACYIKAGSNPTADSNSTYLPADSPEYFTVNPGALIAGITA